MYCDWEERNIGNLKRTRSCRNNFVVAKWGGVVVVMEAEQEVGEEM